MKILNKQEFQQIAFNHSSDIGFEDFINLCKSCKSFLVIDTTLASDHHLHFRRSFIERILKLVMTIHDKIRDEKLQCSINREASKLSAISSGKTSKYEYSTNKDILPSDQSMIIKKAKFTYSPLGKAFEKQIKTIEDQGKKTI